MKIFSKFLPLILVLVNTGCGFLKNTDKQQDMNNDATWNDSAREDLRDSIQNIVFGEVRLANSNHEDIIDLCRDYIQDESPEPEWDSFVRFATEKLAKESKSYDNEKESWPHETDCDRLDRVEAALRDHGILFWQVSPCCDTCTGGELPDRIDAIEKRYPGFREKVRGYAFFIDQNMADMLSENTRISVYLAYGWFPQDGSDISTAEYEKNALDIGHKVCDYLREFGFEPDWNGDFSKKIGITLDWQRRTMLK